MYGCQVSIRWLAGGFEAKGDGDWPLRFALFAWFAAAYTFYFGGTVSRLYPDTAVFVVGKLLHGLPGPPKKKGEPASADSPPLVDPRNRSCSLARSSLPGTPEAIRLGAAGSAVVCVFRNRNRWSLGDGRTLDPRPAGRKGPFLRLLAPPRKWTFLGDGTLAMRSDWLSSAKATAREKKKHQGVAIMVVPDRARQLQAEFPQCASQSIRLVYKDSMWLVAIAVHGAFNLAGSLTRNSV
jgi:hypothetical protein